MPERYIVVVLGTAQDGGIPHAGCTGMCCTRARAEPALRRTATCLGIGDTLTGRWWMLDATPNFPTQLEAMQRHTPAFTPRNLAGIFISHAHIGHYTGLMYLGREAMNTAGMPVYTMPRMAQFILHNAPWSGLVEHANIQMQVIRAAEGIALADGLSLEALPVPHRGEYSETVAFIVHGPEAALLYLPDIDDWGPMQPAPEKLFEQVSCAYVDGCFYDKRELGPARLQSVPHPCIKHSLERFAPLAPEIKDRLRFFHLNHSNPAAVPGSAEHRYVEHMGFAIAEEGESFALGG